MQASKDNFVANTGNTNGLSRMVVEGDLQSVDDEESSSGASGTEGGGMHSTSENDPSCSVANPESLEKHLESTTKRTLIVAFSVVLVGALAAAGFLTMGIQGANQSVEDSFERSAEDMAKEVEVAWADFERSALWIHDACRNWRGDNYTQHDFDILFNYITSDGLEFFSAVWVPNVTHDERGALEQVGAEMWSDEPLVNYTGFTGQEPSMDPVTGNPTLVQTSRSEQPFYFPIHFGAPVKNIALVVHYDLYSAPWETHSIQRSTATGEPTLTGRFELVAETEETGYGVVLYHPGPKLDIFAIEPRDLAAIAVNVNSLLLRASRKRDKGLQVYLYDTTSAEPEFLSGVSVNGEEESATELRILPEIDFESLQGSKQYYSRDFAIGGRTWTYVAVPSDGAFEAYYVFIILSGSLIFAASLLLAMQFRMRRTIQMNEALIKATADAKIVNSLFPASVQKRMLEEATKAGGIKSSDERNNRSSVMEEVKEEGPFGSRPIADLYPFTTVIFADLVGFTSWSATRTPTDVFQLLETLYDAFDKIAARKGVFKIETIGDCYVAVTGVPRPQKTHAVIMARFASECIKALNSVTADLEESLGPGTRDLKLRVGLHSGPVTAGVLRGQKARFQLFGDTVNTAARMESNGSPMRIHVSKTTADALIAQGKSRWLQARPDMVHAKGKGEMQTFWVTIREGSVMSSSVGDDGSLASFGLKDGLPVPKSVDV